MMIRHLLLDAIEHYSEDGIVPIFLMLKDYDVSGSSLFEYLVAKIHNFSPGINTEQLTSLLDEGRCLLLLDGLDEVGTKQADTFEKKLEEFGKIKGRLMKVAELSNQEKLMAAGYKEA